MTFGINEVYNETKNDNAWGTGIYTYASMSHYITYKEFNDVKDYLANNKIETFKIKFDEGISVEEPVKESNAIAAQGKFICFFKYLVEKGIDGSKASGRTPIEFSEEDLKNSAFTKDSTTGLFINSKVFDVPETSKADIYKTIKLYLLEMKVTEKYFTLDFPPDKLVVSFPFTVGDPKYGKAEITFDIKDNKFRKTTTKIEYSEDLINWDTPELTGDMSIIKWYNEKIDTFNLEITTKFAKKDTDW